MSLKEDSVVVVVVVGVVDGGSSVLVSFSTFLALYPSFGLKPGGSSDGSKISSLKIKDLVFVVGSSVVVVVVVVDDFGFGAGMEEVLETMINLQYTRKNPKRKSVSMIKYSFNALQYS